MMIGVERIARALKIISATQAVKDGIGGVSVNLIAPSDSGKSQLMLSSMPHGSRVLNDVTTMTLNELMQEKKPPTYIVIPDLNIVISHKPAVAELTMSMLLALMGEGVSELHPGLQNSVKIRMTKARKSGLRISLMTGVTPEMFYSKRGKWRSTGLLRRLVPLNYAYTKRTQERIQKSIAEGRDALNYTHSRATRIPPRMIDIPNRYQESLRQLSEQVIDQLQWRAGDSREGRQRTVQATEYPFSAHKVLRQLARAAALVNDHGVVTADDFRETESVAEFMRYDRPCEV
jgi:hypothetical protein